MKKLITLLCICMLGFVSASAQCSHTINLTDSYADGWQWAGTTGSVDVIVDGNTVLTGITCTGAASTFTFEASTASTIELANWVEDQYSSEYGWIVLDGGGSEIASGGAGETAVGAANCPSCPSAALTSLNVQSESATAGWDSGDDFTEYTLEIGDTGFVLGTGTSYTTTEISFTFTGLSENTPYSFYLTPSCGADQGDPSGPYSFTTYCNTIATEWSSDFSAGFCPWSIYNVNGDNYGWSLVNPFSGVAGEEYVINNYTPASSSDYLISPTFTCTAGVNDRIKFDSYNNYYSYGSQYYDVLSIQVWDADIANQLGELEQITPGAEYSTYEYFLGDYVGQDIRLAIVSAQSGGAQANGVTFVDNVIADAWPTCVAPVSFLATSTTSNSIELTIESGGSANESSFNVEYGEVGFTPGAGTTVNTTSNIFNLDNLTSGTIYDIYVQSDCGSTDGVSEMTGPLTVVTNLVCGDNFGPYCYDGGTSTLFTAEAPQGTELMVMVDSGDTESGYDNLQMYEGIGTSGELLYNADGDHAGASVSTVDGFITVVITADGGYDCNDGTGGPYTELGFNVTSITPANEDMIACDSAEWNGVTYSETGAYTFSTTGECDTLKTLQLTINQSSGNNELLTACLTYDWYGDTYTESGTYYAQGLNSAGCVLYDTLVLTISTEATTIDPIACDSYTWNDSTYTSSTTATFSGGCGDDIMNLTINNSYDDLINETACDSFAWDNGITYFNSGTYDQFLQTSEGCDSIITLELTVNMTEYVDTTVVECSSYDFNGETLTVSGDYIDTVQTLAGCDSVISLTLVLNATTDSINEITCENSYDFGGNTITENGVYTESLTSSSTGCDSITVLTLTFSGTITAPFVENFDEGVPACWTQETATDSLDWTLSSGTTPSPGTGPEGDVNGDGNYMYVEMSGSTYPNNAILYTASYDVSGLTTAELKFFSQMTGFSTGDLTINMIDGNTSTEIFNVSGDQGPDWTEQTVELSPTSSTISFEIVAENDTAYFNNGGDMGPWTWMGDIVIDEFGVSEKPDCYDPYNINQTAVEATSATFEWSTNSSITAWNVVVVEEGEDPLAATPEVVTTGSVTLTGLTEATNYEFYVQSDCGSDWEGPFVFSTLFPDGYGCAHSLNMFDSWGDGWNGGSIDISVNGILVVANGSIDNSGSAVGNEGTIEFAAADGDAIHVSNFIPGGYPGEITFEVTDGAGEIIYESGALDENSVIDTALAGFCPQNDISAIAAAVPSGCDLTSTEDIEIWVYNGGVAAETGFSVSYEVNGGTAVEEIISESVEPGDTLMYVFTTQADMSAAGDYDVTLYCSLTTDIFSSNDTVVAMGMNVLSPMVAPATTGDSICAGDTAYVMAMSDDGFIVWYDAMTEGNAVAYGGEQMMMDTVSTSYYAEVRAEIDIISDDFEAYTAGDLIAATTEAWEAWSGPNGGGADDAEVSNAQAATGSNSLYLSNAAGDDVVLPLGDEAIEEGIVTLEMDMYITTTGYFNLQTQPIAGLGWAFSVFFDGGSVDITEGATNTALSGTYPGANTWFNVALALDIDAAKGQLFIDGESQGTFEFNSTLGGVNIYANAGDDYYIDNVAATYVSGCSSERTEAIVTVEDCNTNVDEIINGNVSIYPNPNNGEFMVSNTSEIITITITDVQGKTVHSMNNLNIDKVNIDMTDLEKGMYLINIETGNGTVTKPVMLK